MKTKSGPHKIGLVSLGCAKNLVDSELLAKQLEANQFELIFDPVDYKGIDTAIINTCGFINDAKQESIDTILQFVPKEAKNKIKFFETKDALSKYLDENIDGKSLLLTLGAGDVYKIGEEYLKG